MLELTRLVHTAAWGLTRNLSTSQRLVVHCRQQRRTLGSVEPMSASVSWPLPHRRALAHGRSQAAWCAGLLGGVLAGVGVGDHVLMTASGDAASLADSVVWSWRPGGGTVADPRVPGLLWSAPGSMGVSELAGRWERGADLSGVTSVTGPWGVVLWDPGAAEFVVAVDSLGIQPLFWARTAAGGVVVSASLAAVTDEPGVDDSLDVEGVLITSLFMLQAPSVAERTSFASIRRIPAGHAARIGLHGRVRVVRYWDPWTLPETDESMSLAQCVGLLRDRIDTAISRAIGDSVAVGAHVSGGLHSTAVACRAHQQLRQAGRGGLIAGYSWSPTDALVPRLRDDERDRIDAAARADGFPVRYRDAGESDGGFSTLDPDRYPWTIVTDETTVMVKAASDGVQVMLNGFGGDEAASFKGNQVRAQRARRGQFDRIAWQAQQAAAHTGATPGHQAAAVLRDLAGGLLDLLPTSAQRAARPLRHRRLRRHDRHADALLRADFPAAADARLERLERDQAARTPREVMITKLTAGYLQERINSWYQVGQLHQLHYRYPLLDLDVVTAAVAMPDHAFTCPRLEPPRLPACHRRLDPTGNHLATDQRRSRLLRSPHPQPTTPAPPTRPATRGTHHRHLESHRPTPTTQPPPHPHQPQPRRPEPTRHPRRPNRTPQAPAQADHCHTQQPAHTPTDPRRSTPPATLPVRTGSICLRAHCRRERQPPTPTRANRHQTEP